VPFTRPAGDRRAGHDRGRLQIAEDFDAPLPECPPVTCLR
jgi:hypothetical protein